tara:strand:+ start:222 stop:407 length:186 start_codon:yes stop_codon:yes gene_type:complete
MNYETTEALFNHMCNLEMYSKLYSKEINKSDPEWDTVSDYGNSIKAARKGIFEVLQDQQDV